MTRAHLLIAAATTSLFVNVSHAAVEPIRQLVPSDAKFVDVRKIGNGKQVSYVVVREYPSSGIQKDALDALRKEGWVYCKKRDETEWSSFLDSAGGSRERIYQRLSYLRKGERLITIGERYYAKSASQLQPGAQGRPEDKNQEVVIVDSVLGSKAIVELLESSRATCEIVK